jgi:hypothetical protein
MNIKDWFRPRGAGIEWSLSEFGFEFRLPDHPLNPARLLLKQLEEEGLASGREERVLLPWATVERLASDDDSADVAPILGLPPIADVKVALAATGSPSDENFCIQIAGWRVNDRRFAPSQVRVFQGVIQVDGGVHRLTPELTALVSALREASQAENAGKDERFFTAAKIRALATKAGAELDVYLHQTDFIPVETPEIDLRADTGDGETVIEISPRISRAPEQFVGQFDRYPNVRSRYDVPDEGGHLAHIALSNLAKSGYEKIKQLPRRRVSGAEAEALIKDPTEILGPEFAHLCQSPDWEDAVRRSGALPLQMRIEAEDKDAAVVHFLGVDDSYEDVTVELNSASEARDLLSTVIQARQRHRSSVVWRGTSIQLDARCDDELSRLGRWIARRTVDDLGLASSDVFDRDAYSDRVAGFDGKPIHVPVLNRPDRSSEWLPENIPQGIVSVDPKSGDVRVVPISDGEMGALRSAVETAKVEGASHVNVLGLPDPVPREVAEEWLKGWNQKPNKGQPQIQSADKPRPRKTPSLRIFDNIDVLEFGRDVIPPPPDELDVKLPSALRAGVQLKTHQVSGVSTLQHRFKQRDLGVTGLLLADDMGLGKTLQCLAFLAWYFETQPSAKACLVVAPVSLLENWRNEVGKFLDWPENSVLSLYGQALQAARLGPDTIDPDLAALGLRKFLRPGFSDGYRLVLTTYETLRDYEFSFGRVDWGILVCDEAQKIKTPSAQVTRSAKAMKADFKVACTGTPVENTLADYWCLFDFFQPGMLGSLSQFTKKFRKAIELREEGFEEQVEVLRRATQPLVLRRMKSDVAELPPKIDSDHPDGANVRAELPMSDLQMALYGDAIGKFRSLLSKGADEREKGAILGVLHRLRTICSHPLSL